MELHSIKTTARVLKARLTKIDADEFGHNQWFQDNFKLYRQDLDYILARYVRLLHCSCRQRNPRRTRLLDFGGGIGILALLAKLSGLELVVYMDIIPERAECARKLADACNIHLDDYCVGSYEDLESFCSHRVDVVCNYDVLEHLYDPQLAFAKLGSILRPGGEVRMASGANQYNPVQRMLFRRLHYQLENKIENPWSKLRENIIRESCPGLAEHELNELVRSTRGLRREDIEKAVANYRESGELPVPAEGTNTCHPETGSGGENLLDAFKLAKALSGFYESVHVEAGRWPVAPPRRVRYGGPKSIVASLYPTLHLLSAAVGPVFNAAMTHLPLRLQLMLAPYYAVVARAA